LGLSPLTPTHSALVHIHHGFATATFSPVAMAVVDPFDSSEDFRIV